MQSELLTRRGHLRVTRRVGLFPGDNRSPVIEVVEEQKLETEAASVEVHAPTDVCDIQNRLDLASEFRLCMLHDNPPPPNND